MPVQKGKRHKRPRGGRYERMEGAAAETGPPVQRETTARARPVPRRRGLFALPMQWKAALGASMLVVGIIFFFMPQKGSTVESRLIFLAGYCLLAALYLGSAYREWRARSR